MILQKEKKGDVTIFHVKKKYEDAEIVSKKNTYVKPKDIQLILQDDADVYTEEGKLLLKFRKNVLNENKINEFYENIIKFAKGKTSNRGSTSGAEKHNMSTGNNPEVMTNIFGYFDRWSPMQKYTFTKRNQKIPLEVRPCRFNIEHPDLYEKTLPLIREIDTLYSKMIPAPYKKQRAKANQTYFKVDDTAFTTITTNVNFQTTIHTDKGDDAEGFGNLVVIERGDYEGGETCFPQYGLGVNLRSKGILFMDVHQPHANLPIRKKTKDAVRLSVVCYLREKVWLRTKGKSKEFFNRHNRTVRNLKAKKK
jgi:hypothetical protein